ncbi:hypothetical protein TIFTF001_053884 [Ficus carica]|uniref:Uncharacterized protein n=1 Tax=Ficus carica TaxID=3494 RepID=A0AA88EMG1_FICCA|nr:hypothetical protein TIFTF001_053884 [Ficus carica]
MDDDRDAALVFYGMQPLLFDRTRRTVSLTGWLYDMESICNNPNFYDSRFPLNKENLSLDHVWNGISLGEQGKQSLLNKPIFGPHGTSWPVLHAWGTRKFAYESMLSHSWLTQWPVVFGVLEPWRTSFYLGEVSKVTQARRDKQSRSLVSKPILVHTWLDSMVTSVCSRKAC